MDRGVWTAKTLKRPPQQPAHPQYAKYWAPLTCKRHIPPHSAQPQHANYWAPRTRKQHQQEHRPQWPTESSDPTQHAKGRTGDCPGPRKGATTGRNVTQGGHAHARPTEWWSTGGGWPERRVEQWGTWASRTRKCGEAGGGRRQSGGVWAAKTVKQPPQQPAQPRYANYWAPLTHTRHPPQPTQPRHTNHWAPRTRHQQEHRPQRPTQRSDPTQHAKGRTGDCPGPRKGTTTRRNVTQGGGGGGWTHPPPTPASEPERTDSFGSGVFSGRNPSTLAEQCRCFAFRTSKARTCTRASAAPTRASTDRPVRTSFGRRRRAVP